MPRKRRKRLVGKAEDIERDEREGQYAELEAKLHRDWEARQSDDAGEQPVTDDDTNDNEK